MSLFNVLKIRELFKSTNQGTRISTCSLRQSKNRIPCLYLIFYGIIQWFFFSMPAIATESTNSNRPFPLGAFWIDNHWRNIRGCAQFSPVHWRNSTGCLRVLDDEEEPISKQGLNSLLISGSANPTFQNLLWIKKTYGENHPIYIIDLRQETHLFVNGLPVSIFYKRNEINWGKSPELIQTQERNWVDYLSQKKSLLINQLGRPVNGLKVPTHPLKLSIQEISTEKEAVHKAGLNYFRITVSDFHPPTAEQVDQFLKFYQNRPPKAWLHFHCAAGNGRTTTFMVMTDILANARDVSLDDIVRRQALLGGIDLFAVSKSLKLMPWKSKYHKARVEFIKLFYSYVHQGKYPKQSFSSWIAKQKTDPYQFIKD